MCQGRNGGLCLTNLPGLGALEAQLRPSPLPALHRLPRTTLVHGGSDSPFTLVNIAMSSPELSPYSKPSIQISPSHLKSNRHRQSPLCFPAPPPPQPKPPTGAVSSEPSKTNSCGSLSATLRLHGHISVSLWALCVDSLHSSLC